MSTKGAFETIAMSTLVFLVLLNFYQSSAQGQSTKQTSTLYSFGKWYSLAGDYFPDLNSKNFDNIAHSTCLTGTWLFYTNTNYDGDMEYFFDPIGDSKSCYRFQNIGGHVSSVKYVGSKDDYRISSLTLYHGQYFTGTNELVLLGDSPNINLSWSVASLIITGKRPWTLYTQTNYGGNSICVQHPVDSPDGEFTPAFIGNIRYFGFWSDRDRIRSAQVGCYSPNKVTGPLLIPKTNY